MKKILFVIIFLTIALCGEDEYSDQPKYIYLYNVEQPSTVYANQIFSITIKALILTNNYKTIQTFFGEMSNLNVLNKNSKWKLTGKNEYHNTFQFKANNKQFILPKITLNLFDDSENILYFQSINFKNIKLNNIASDDKYFSNIVASDLNVIFQNTKQYDNNFLLTTLNIEATDSNLEDFNVSYYKTQEVKSFKKEENIKSILFDVIIPRDSKNIMFKYYNTTEKKLKTILTNIVLNEQLINSQIDLNPKKSNLILYQKRTLIGFMVLFVILYVFTKRKINFLAISILLILFTYISLPNRTIVIKENTNIYILPIINSTVFQTSSSSLEVQSLKKRNGFIKIMLPNETIGWIKE